MALTECVDCGGAVSTKAETCPHCGRLLEPQPPLSSDGEGTPTYAGFWVRFCAVLIDSVVVTVGAGILGIIIGIAIALVSPDTLENPVFDILTGLGGSIGGAAYFVFMHSSSKQATLGKMAMGLKVTDLDGERIGVGKSFLRLIGTVVSAVVLMPGYLMWPGNQVAFTERKQFYHDKIAGTFVVRD